MLISQRSFDFTVAQEVTSKAYYIKHYQKPEWPGLSSGPTVGIGYDLGQASAEKIRRDWSGLVSGNTLFLMMSCAGFTGKRGEAKTKEVKDSIIIPWEAAIKVFSERDVPEWVAGVLKYIPAASRLPPSCLGVLFDLAYNRGHSWNNNDERYKEMRAIKAHVQAGNYALVPGEIKSMKRLWPKTAGLLRRCDQRIDLWRYGLEKETTAKAVPIAAPAAPLPPLPVAVIEAQDTKPARTKPPATSAPQNATGAVVAAGGAAVAAGAYTAGWADSGTAILAAALGVAIAAVIWYAWFRNRNPK